MSSWSKRLFINSRICRPATRTLLCGLTVSLFPMGFVPDSEAAFALNWQQATTAEGATFVDNDAYFCGGFSYMSCNGGGNSGWGGSRGSGNNDSTPFLQETLQLNGQTYFHLIVGDYTKDSFAQEVYIHVTGGNTTNDNITFSDSLCGSDCASNQRNFSAGDALSSDSNYNGNGGGNPSNVMMQQVLNDGTIDQVFLKDSFTQKPLISETITTPDIATTFVVDMRGLNYSQLTPINPSTMIDTVTLLGSNRNGTSGNFNVQTQAQALDVTAGGFTYTPTPILSGGGSGQGGGGNGFGGGGRGGGGNGQITGSSGGGGGTYTYVDSFKGDSFQPLNQDYAAFCVPSENNNATGSGNGSGGFGGFGSGGGTACGGTGSGTNSGGGRGGW